MRFEALVRDPDEIAIELTFRCPRLAAAHQQNCTRLRIEREGDPSGAIRDGEAKFLHVDGRWDRHTQLHRGGPATIKTDAELR